MLELHVAAPPPGAPVQRGDEMNPKGEAIRAMKFAGWIVDNPDAIVVEEHRDDLTVLKQDGVGTWFVSDAGVTFFEE